VLSTIAELYDACGRISPMVLMVQVGADEVVGHGALVLTQHYAPEEWVFFS
jgi:hypothetical protein